MNSLKVCNEVIEVVEEAINKMTQTEISRKLDKGAGGDITIGIDKAAEEAAIEVLKNYDVHLISEIAHISFFASSLIVLKFFPADQTDSSTELISPIFISAI